MSDDIILPSVLAVDENKPTDDLGFDFPITVDNLDDIAERIKLRDWDLETRVRSHWYETGRDLIAAKRLAGHGKFEAWCSITLKYSKSKAENLMRAAEMFGPLLESITVTDLPPPTLFYKLSAPSTPQAIRDEFVPRVLAKEGRIATKLKIALKEHRALTKLAERSSTGILVEPKTQPEDDQAKADCDEREVEHNAADLDQQVAARSAAVELLLARLGDSLPEFLTHLAEAGSANVFSVDAEHELLMRAKATLPVSVKAVALDEKPDEDAEAAAPETFGSDCEDLAPPATAVHPCEGQIKVLTPVIDTIPTLDILNTHVNSGKYCYCDHVLHKTPNFRQEHRRKALHSIRQSIDGRCLTKSK